MHTLANVINRAEGFVLIGNSSEDRFPAMSYHAYSTVRKKFYCLDMGGLPSSRGGTKGGKVYHSVAELPADHDDLAVIWVHPRTAVRAVELAHEAGCRRIWFSFQTGHPDAVQKARELGMQIVENGRCPVYYLEGDKPTACKVHTLGVKATGTYGRPPQIDAVRGRRELW